MKIEGLRIGDTVVFPCGNKESIPMQVVGLFSDGTVYLDFEGNEGDVWEEEAKNLKMYKDNTKGCLRDKNKVCNMCHDCDVFILNPSY